jgi:integrase
MGKPFTPFLYLRRGRSKRGEAGAIWYIVLPGPNGEKKWKPTKCRGPAEEGKARKLLAEFIRLRELKAGAEEEGPLTVRRWANTWLTKREAKGIESAYEYRSQLNTHVLPLIGDLRLDAVTSEHIEQVMATVAAKGRAPKTRRNVYFTMHAMFRKAVPKYLEANPCAMDEDDMPAKVDADPEWRATAVFSKDEVHRILTDARIPEDRRTFYGLLFLAGPRFGEAAALCVRHYLREMQPLGQLVIARSWNTKRKKLKSTKTNRTRKVPVHPALAALLDEWLAQGFRAWMGRAPLPDDPLIPSRWWQSRTVTHGELPPPDYDPPETFRHRNSGTMYQRFQADLERLGLRSRRQHDTRRTFISLARDDGASKELLRSVTHAPEGDIMDAYSELAWRTLCGEVLKLQFTLPAPGAPDIHAEAKSMNSLDRRLPLGSQPGNPEIFPVVGEWAQQGSKTTTPPEQPSSSEDQRRDDAGLGQAPPASTLAERTPGEAMATLATLAFRQALSALDRGRLDELRAILERALAAEQDAARLAKGGGR